MLSNNKMLCSTLCGILAVFIYRGANAAVIRGEIFDVGDLLLEPNLIPDAYLEEEDLMVDPLGGYDDYFAERKFKRQISAARKEDVGELMPRPPLSSQNVKELLRLLRKPKKSEFLKLNGWSASGMPFNVLYTPNSLQQKFLSSVGSAPERKPAPVPTPQPLRRENYVSPRKEDKKEYLRSSGLKTSTRSAQMRKHYLVIPQLFVSYGWGSLGK